MGAVTIGAIGRILLILVVSLSMATGKVHIEYLGVTGRTIHRFVGGAGALEMFGHFGMALGALDVLVHGIGKLSRVHKKRYGIALYNLM